MPKIKGEFCRDELLKITKGDVKVFLRRVQGYIHSNETNHNFRNNMFFINEAKKRGMGKQWDDEDPL